MSIADIPVSGDLIDRIYEAAILPDLWPGVLDRIAELNGSDLGGLLRVANPNFYGWTSSQIFGHLYSELRNSEVADKSPRLIRSVELDHAGFLTDHMILTPQEIEASPFYNWIRARDFGWSCWTFVRAPGEDVIAIAWNRRNSTGPFDTAAVAKMDTLRPHLARSALMAGRLSLQRAITSADVLTLLGMPAAVLSLSRKLLHANSLLEALIPRQVQDRNTRFVFTDPRADALLNDALTAMPGPVRAGTVNSIPIAGVEDLPPTIAHVLPLSRAARDIFTASMCLLVLTPVTQSAAPSAQMIQALFDLTPAEARAAAGIAAGKTLKEIATATGLSANTIKTQLRAVFIKTGVSRQAELASLLAGTKLF